MVTETERLSATTLIDRVRELIHEGNVRRIIIKNEMGHTIVELPVTLGVIGAIVAPTLAAVGAIAALLNFCTIEVVRDESYVAPKPYTEEEEALEELVPGD